MAKDISKNKVFQSPYKDEIEKRLSIGQSPRAISKWLETRGETISYATINEYKKNFFNIDAKVSKIIKEKQEELEELPTVEDKTKEMETQLNMQIGTMLAINHIKVLYENIIHMQEYLAKLQQYEPVVAAHAARGLFQEIRATIETLEKIKDKDDSGNESSVAKAISALKKQAKEAERIGKLPSE